MALKPPARPAPSDGDGASEPQQRRGTLGWAKGLLSRSVVVEKRRNQLHVALVDRSPEALRRRAASLLVQMRDELRARLLVYDRDALAVRHIFEVHKALEHGGWDAVQALPAAALGRALHQAEVLQSEEPSELLAAIIVRLGEAKSAAEATAELKAKAVAEHWHLPDVPEVSEATHEEYELMERSWIGTVPTELGQPEVSR